MSPTKVVLLLSFMTGCLTLASCAATQPRAQAADAPASIHEITVLYHQVTEPHRRQFRRTVRDHQMQEMRVLADKADALLAATADWDDARLTGANVAANNASREKVRSFRSALKGLRDTARRGNITALRHDYAAVMASYSEIVSLAQATD
ncbi:MAG: hypothetical protein GX616_04375 [Planctomycetes bacterium]|nr:hypothetical protein [Planctomycetota bacterium]